MTKRGLVAIAVLGIAVAVAYWWRTRGSDEPPPPPAAKPVVAAKPVENPLAAVALQAHVTVTVSDAKGPLANAMVRLAPDDGDVIALKTDTQGVAHSDVAPGRWAVSASAPDHEAKGEAQQLSPGEDAKVALVLPAGGRTLTGLVTDAYNGPIAGVRIDAARFVANAPSLAVASTTTGSDGRYKLTVAEGSLVVGAYSPDYAAQARFVVVGPAGATADFALVPGGVIEGIVRDDKTHEPVPAASVEASQDQNAIYLVESMHRATSGPDGRFRIAGLRPGAYDLRARAGERFTRAPTRLGLEVAEQVANVELLVGAGPVVRGKVIDEDGKPVSDVRVFAAGESRGNADAVSSATGTFAFVGLPPGRWAVLVNSDTHVSDGITAFELATQDKDIVVKVRRGAKITGHVEPREACEVRIDTTRTTGDSMMFTAPSTTGVEGAFELGPTHPGKAVVVARCDSGDEGEVETPVPANDVVLHVAPGGTIAGRVADGDGKPLAGVVVMAQATGGSEHTVIVNGVVTSGAQSVTGADGAYQIRGLAAGAFRMTVLDRGHPLRMRAQTKVTLAASEHKTGVDLAVDRATGEIRGTVTDADGKPVADAWVSVHQDIASLVSGMMKDAPEDKGSGESSRMVTVENDGAAMGAGDLAPAVTDASGHYVLSGLPHASFEVIAEAQGGKLRARHEDVTPDATIDLQLAGVTSLTGTVHGAKGLFTVALEGPTQTTRSFAGGEDFEIERVDPGDYKVSVTSSDGNGTASVHVDPGKATHVDITLASNAVVIGKLVDSTGKPVANLPVVLTEDKGDGKMSVSVSGPPPESGPDGSFRLEAKPGPSILVVLTRPRPVSKKVVLEAGKTVDAGAITVDSR